MLDDIHRRHREACAVDEAGDVAVEADVVEVVFGSGDLARILLFLVAHCDDVRVAVEGVVVEAELRVEREHAAVRGGDERVDFQHRAIALDEELVEVGKQFPELLGDVSLKAEFGGNLADLIRLQAEQRVDDLAENFLRGVVRHILDAHAACRGCDDDRRAGGAIHQDGEIVFVGDVHRLGDHHFAHQASFLAGLHGDEGLVEHFPGELSRLCGALDEMHSALEAVLEMAFSAPARMDLRLDHKFRPREFLCGRCRLLRRTGDFPLRTGDLETVEELFGLVFVDVHRSGRVKTARF